MRINFVRLRFGHLFFSCCIVIRIGFAQAVYQFIEPQFEMMFRVNLVREDNRQSEQTFQVEITVGPPSGNRVAATIETSTELGDYRTGSSRTIVTANFPAQSQNLEFNFIIHSDNILEGIEAFQASSRSVQFSSSDIPRFQPPLSDSRVFQNTEIQIIDNDSEYYVSM